MLEVEELDELLGAGTGATTDGISEPAARFQVGDASELALLHCYRQMPARRRKALLLLLTPN
jgi:hypothetical protein